MLTMWNEIRILHVDMRQTGVGNSNCACVILWVVRCAINAVAVLRTSLSRLKSCRMKI